MTKNPYFQHFEMEPFDDKAVMNNGLAKSIKLWALKD